MGKSAEQTKRLEASERKQLAALRRHANPVIREWRMLPSHYPGVVEGSRFKGYEIKCGGKTTFLPLGVARRLVKRGQCEERFGGLFISVNDGWAP